MSWKSLGLVVVASLATGCTNIEGAWEGNCQIAEYGYVLDIPTVLEVDEDSGGDIEGEGRVTFYGYNGSGDLEGSRDGEDVNLELDLTVAGYTITMKYVGEVDGDRMEGDCTWQGQGYNLRGDFDLELD